MYRLALDIENALQEGLSSSKLLGVSFVAIDKHGHTLCSKAYGHRDFDKKEAMTVDTAGWAASMTKLMTAIATLRAVELGLVGLDDDVAEILPELRQKEVLVSYDGETKTATFEPLTEKITLRLLLSHSAGFSYISPLGNDNPLLYQWAVDNNRIMASFQGDFKKDWDLPMVFQPGTSWAYGPGLDWAGKVIEAVSHKTLEEFMQEHIWSPLGMENTTFHPEKRQSFSMLEMARREDGVGSKLVPAESKYPVPALNEAGGAGIFTTAEDYAKMVSALLHDDGRLLQKASIEELVKPQLGKASKQGLKMFRDQNVVMREIPSEIEVDHAIGGLYFVDNVPGGRSKASIAWDGLTNPSWLLDRKTGVAMVIFVQILDFDQDTKNLWRRAEGEVYKFIARTT